MTPYTLWGCAKMPLCLPTASVTSLTAADRPGRPTQGVLGCDPGAYSGQGSLMCKVTPLHRGHLLTNPSGGFAQRSRACHDVRHMQCRSRGVCLGSCVAVSAALLPELIGRPFGPTPIADPPADAALPGARAAETAAACQRGGNRTPVLLTHGALDDVVPRRDADASAAELRALGASLPGFGQLFGTYQKRCTRV